jgi:hypothetical protein
VGPSRYDHPKSVELFDSESLNIDGITRFRTEVCARCKSYGQAERAISTGQLNALLRFHIRPINQVVYLGPSYLTIGRSHLEAGFALICIQRLS